MSPAGQPDAAEPGVRRRGSEFWERAAWGVAAGGLAVWVLAAAARAGWLRVLLDLYPRSSWERITWVLIPVLLLLPLITQGVVVAFLAPSRPFPTGRGILGSIAGTVGGLAAGLAVFVLAGRVRGLAGGSAARAIPISLTLGCGALLVAAAFSAAGRSSQIAWLRFAAVPAAATAALVAWVFAREWVLEASSVLDRAETLVFVIAVVVGGAVGAAWSVGARGRTR
jgi:hypothetical protein